MYCFIFQLLYPLDSLGRCFVWFLVHLGEDLPLRGAADAGFLIMAETYHSEEPGTLAYSSWRRLTTQRSPECWLPHHGGDLLLRGTGNAGFLIMEETYYSEEPGTLASSSWWRLTTHRSRRRWHPLKP